MMFSLWMLQNTLAAGCLAIVVTLACRFGRFSPAVRHALWLLVLLKLVTPPLVEVPIPRSFLDVSLPQESGERTSGGRTLVWIAAERFYDFSDDEPDRQSESTSGSAAHVPPQSELEDSASFSRSTAVATSARAPTTTAVATLSSIIPAWLADRARQRFLLAAWSVGTALFVLIQGRRLLNLRRMKRRGHLDAGLLTGLVALLARQMRVRQPPVWIVPDLPSPALCAWGRASLLWPEEGATQLSEAGERAVVLHELAHLRRRDHWVGWLELVAGCVWWWNPLFWYVRHQLHENAELACDSWVVALLPEERRAYAEALIDVAQGAAPSPLAGVVLGAGDGSRKLMERRLIMIMRGKVRYQVPAIGVAVLALVALATIPRWTIGREATVAGDQFDGDAELGASAQMPPKKVIYARSFSAPHLPETNIRKSDPVASHESTPGFETGDEDAFQSVPDLPVAAIADATLADDQDPANPVLAAPSSETIGEVKPASKDSFAQDVISSESNQFAPSSDAAPADEQIRRLEAQLSAVQSELNALRGRKPPTGQVLTPSPEPKKKPLSNLKVADQKKSDPKQKMVYALKDQGFVLTEDSSVETVVMTRSTYKLPPGRAIVLERALRELLSDDVEIKVKNDSLQITAAEEDQDAIHHLIRLMRRKGRAPADLLLDVKPTPESINTFDGPKDPDSSESTRRPAVPLEDKDPSGLDFKPPERR